VGDVMSSIFDRHDIERSEGWREYAKRMPWIKFPADWQVAVIPPFAGALARFRVKLPSGTEKSIYFDAHEALGYFGAPYWEVHPYQGDVGRCEMTNTDELLRMIADESEAGESK
jgi:hypothetical protein